MAKKGGATLLTGSCRRNLKHNSCVEAHLGPLLPLYERERAHGRTFALAVVVHTRGSTYRKPGALMAIAADGSYAGLLSGGCLESDLREHARAVIESGEARSVSYDTGGSDDVLWGLGVGCEGAMQILLLPVGAASEWQPLSHLAAALASHTPTAVGIVVEARAPRRSGEILLPGGGRSDIDGAHADALAEAARSGRPSWLDAGSTQTFIIPLALPPRLLLLGGGPDALPIADLALRLGWRVTVYDHRSAYARAEQFPAGTHVMLARPEELATELDLATYEAAVVMSHHLPSDLSYLEALAPSSVGYVGLLGPPLRRERLLEDLGTSAQPLRGRLHAPVGLDLGGRTPESIALAIVAEVHAYLHERAGGPMREQEATARAALATAPASVE